MSMQTNCKELRNYSVDFVEKQLFILRIKTKSLPIIFTIRTKTQSGNFDDNNIESMYKLFEVALKTNVEFIDLELTMPIELQKKIIDRKC